MGIYLDHAATTPLRPEALEAMLPYLTRIQGNPSSAHAFGREARVALDEAHERIATAIGASARELVITSGGTEAINFGLKGAAWAGKARGHRIVTTAVEHHAVAHSLAHLEKFGFEVQTLPVDRYGRVDPDELDAAIGDRTILVSVMLANNEVGTIEPMAEIAERVHRHRGVLLHVDAVQGAAYLDIDVAALGADLLSIGAHKFEGPKGVGALWIRGGTHILAQQHGGSQERHRRAGTENVAGAVGMGVALELAVRERAEVAPRLAAGRDRLRKALLAVDGVELTGHPRKRLPNHLSVIVREVDGDALALALDLDGIAVSTGSACTTGSTEVSHVLTAMGYPEEEARGALRVTVGRATTGADLDAAVEAIPRAIERLRAGGRELAAADPVAGAGAP
jgi:cysteine desulfurase